MKEYGTPEFNRSMLLFGLGDIIKGGNGSSFFDHMAISNQLTREQAERADALAREQAAKAEQMAAQQQGLNMSQEALTAFSPRAPNSPQGIADDAMNVLGLPQSPRMSADRASAILNSPNVPDAVKEMVLTQYQGQDPVKGTVVGSNLVNPFSGEVMYQGGGEPTFRNATPEEAAGYGATGGQIDTKTGRFYPINPPSGMSVEVGPNGTRIVQGPGASNSGASNEEFFSAGTFIDQIDKTLNDPALDWSTGVMQWAQVVPGTPMARFKTRADQLSGQAFMNARQALKGGGQITDYEGQRAADAIGRLNTAQSPDDYREALTEVRDILFRAVQRPQGWLEGDVGKIMNMGVGEIQGLIGAGGMTAEQLQAARERLDQIKRWGG